MSNMAQFSDDSSSFGSPDSRSSSPPLIYHAQPPAEFDKITNTTVSKSSSQTDATICDKTSQDTLCFFDLSIAPETVTISSSDSDTSSCKNPDKISSSNLPLVEEGAGDANDSDIRLPEISTLVFFDLETTGLARFIGTQNVHITEISFVAVSKLDFLNSVKKDLSDIRVVNKLSLCVKPRTRVSRAAADITGLDDSNLFRLQPFDEGIGQMVCNFIDRLPKPACLLAHNGNIFDFPLLKSELERLGLALPPEVLTVDTLSAFRGIGLSTPELPPKIPAKKGGRNKKPSYTLENIYKHFFKKHPYDSHSAESDCMSLMMVCHKACDKIMPWFEKNKTTFLSAKQMW